MEIKIDMSGFSLCPYCLGNGSIKVMQSMETYNRESIRGKDMAVKCKYCNGVGLIK